MVSIGTIKVADVMFVCPQRERRRRGGGIDFEAWSPQNMVLLKAIQYMAVDVMCVWVLGKAPDKSTRASSLARSRPNMGLLDILFTDVGAMFV